MPNFLLVLTIQVLVSMRPSTTKQYKTKSSKEVPQTTLFYLLDKTIRVEALKLRFHLDLLPLNRELRRILDQDLILIKSLLQRTLPKVLL